MFALTRARSAARVSNSEVGLVGAVASLLLAHNAAFDEHHDQPAFLFAVAQAISSGGRKGLTLIEGLPVSRLHVVHHVAHAPLLLGESGGADTDGYEGGNNQGVHACLHEALLPCAYSDAIGCVAAMRLAQR